MTAQARDAKQEYIDYIEVVAEGYGMCPELIESMIFYESSWEPEVVGGSCIGLMQINPGSHKERMERLGVTDLKNPYQNILVGIDYLAELAEEYEDVCVALDRYNGQSHPIEWYEAGNMSRYSRKILVLSEKLEREHGK